MGASDDTESDVAVVGQVLAIPIRQIRRFEGQPRAHFDQQALQELASSIEELGQLEAGLVVGIEGPAPYKFELVDGERRFLACQIAGKKTYRATVVQPKDRADQFRLAVAANFGKAEHTPMEISRACIRLQEAGQTWEQIARIFGKSVAWVGQYRSLSKLHPQIQALLEPMTPKAKRIPQSVAYLLTYLKPEAQLGVLRKLQLRGASTKLARFEVEEELRRSGGRSSGSARPKKPSDIVREASRFAQKLEGDAEVFASRRKQLAEAIRSRNSEERQQVRSQLTNAVKFLQQLLQEIEP